MSSTTPLGNPGNPGNPAEPVLGETPIHGRKIAGLPRHIGEKRAPGKSLTESDHMLALNPFRSLVASPATPDTPTPVPQLGPGCSGSSVNPSPLCGSTTPDRSFSPFSTSSLSPPDSPYPSTPMLLPFNSDLSVAERDQNDVDPFETAGAIDEVEKALANAVSTASLNSDPQRGHLQEFPSLLSGAERMVRPNQKSVDVTALGRSTSHLERPFAGDTSLSFHDSLRQYTLDRKKDSSGSNDSSPNTVFVLRSSPQIIEEDSSDEEPESEEQDCNDKTAYSFLCEDSKINELVSMMASLSLGAAPTVARPTITPTRLRARVSPFVPARTPVSSPVALIHPIVSNSSTTKYAIPMEVDKGALHPGLASEGIPHPHEPSEAVSMDGVVFHPEVKEREMMDATTPGAAPTSPMRNLANVGYTPCRPQPTFGSTWNQKFTPNQVQRSVLGAPSSPSRQSYVPRRTVFDFLCPSPKPPALSDPTVPRVAFADS